MGELGCLWTSGWFDVASCMLTVLPHCKQQNTSIHCIHFPTFPKHETAHIRERVSLFYLSCFAMF